MKKSYLYILILFLSSMTLYGQDNNKNKAKDAPGPLQQWATLNVNGQESKAYIAFPDPRHENVSVIIIPDGDGISGWEKSMADKLALEGYSVIMPEMKLYKSAVDEIEAAKSYIIKHSEKKPELYIVGLGNGGSKALSYASQNTDIQGVMYFYSAVPEDLGTVKNMVYAFYGDNDRVLGNEMQEDVKRMSMLGNNFEYYIYPGASHNFMALGAMEDALPENRKARNEAWQQIMKILGMGS
ncbi:MAG: dienelactone hydrolase family protein [Candidatus Cyclobacteriaceae bacterium M2_1C_046]